jgi:hypothetical protein
MSTPRHRTQSSPREGPGTTPLGVARPGIARRPFGHNLRAGRAVGPAQLDGDHPFAELGMPQDPATRRVGTDATGRADEGELLVLVTEPAVLEAAVLGRPVDSCGEVAPVVRPDRQRAHLGGRARSEQVPAGFPQCLAHSQHSQHPRVAGRRARLDHQQDACGGQQAADQLVLCLLGELAEQVRHRDEVSGGRRGCRTGMPAVPRGLPQCWPRRRPGQTATECKRLLHLAEHGDGGEPGNASAAAQEAAPAPPTSTSAALPSRKRTDYRGRAEAQ